MQHFSHKHSLILNEIYHAKEGDMCYGCNEQIVSCRSFVYSCINTSTTATTSDADNECLKFLLHRSCAELPLSIQHPMDQQVLLSLGTGRDFYWKTPCIICYMKWEWFMYKKSSIFVCVKCVMFQLLSQEDRTIDHHPAHSQHPLALAPHLASFKCYACKVDDNIKDLSYMCTKCLFWVHKSCADAPTSFRFQFHNQHPLTLSFSLPEFYQNFYQYCKLCNKRLTWAEWLYYCPKCRFFTHFHCARSNPMFSFSEDETYDSDLVHLPAEDASAVNLLYEEFVKALSSQNNNDDDNSIYNATKGIKHWSHDEHELLLMSINEVSDGKDDDETLLVCDGCVKPIRTDGGDFYGCVKCKYFMHKVCAELPRDIKHHRWPGTTLSAHKYSEPFKCYFFCGGCERRTNGIYFSSVGRSLKYDIGCVSLPKIIKHEAHRHQLIINQLMLKMWNEVKIREFCKACGIYSGGSLVYTCERCEYTVCVRCIMRPMTFKHRWDEHPLQLIYDPAMVPDHEHDYSCEFCSKVIDTNKWFYHCTRCDLSFHLYNYYDSYCVERSCNYLDSIKFGATNIKIDKLHPHSLTYVLNKKVRSCQRCAQKQLGQPVLECAPCKVIFCSFCCDRYARRE